MLSTFVFYSQNWQAHFNDAKTIALKENKNIILVFSGSDWCAPCIKLDQSILQSEAFKNESGKTWVLYRADFPKKKANKLSPELTKENELLAETYNKSGIFPLLLVLDNHGKTLGSLGFENVTPEVYLNKIKKIINN